MLSLVLGDLDESTASEGWEAGLLEVLLVVFGERTVVERVFEMFEGLEGSEGVSISQRTREGEMRDASPTRTNA